MVHSSRLVRGTSLVDIKGQFVSPRGIDVGPGGLLAVADQGRYVVNVIDPANTTTEVVDEILGVNGSATTNRQEYPNNTVFLIGKAGTAGTGEGQFGDAVDSPRDVAFSKDGSLLAVTDPGNNRFQVFQLDTASDGRATGLLHPEGKPAFVLDVPDALNNTLAVGFDSDDRLVTTWFPDPIIGGPSVLQVYNVTLPAVKSVTIKVSSDDGVDTTVLVPGRSIVVDVRFNTNLKVDTSAGTPYMAIGPEHNAEYVGNMTDTLTFKYQAKEGDMPEHFVYDPRTALILNGSAITAGARNVIALTDLSTLTVQPAHS